MKESEHRKQLLIQQIDDHRELMRLELAVLRESNPVKPVIESGRRLLGIVGVMRSGRRFGGVGSIGSRLPAQLDADLVRTALPVVIQVLRSVLQRRKAKRAVKSKKGT